MYHIKTTKSTFPFPCFPPESKSLASRYLTREIYEKLIHIKTSTGFTLSDALKSGIQNRDSSVGIYAGDTESYDKFAPIFNPVIESYHSIENIELNEMKSDFSQLNLQDLDPERKYILSTRIRVARNIDGFRFTTNLSLNDRKIIENLIVNAIANISSPFKGNYYTIKYLEGKENGKDEVKSKILDRIAFRKGDRFQQSAGINSDWPEGRGIFESEDRRFALWINEEDHLRIMCVEKTGDISRIFNHFALGLTRTAELLNGFKLNFAWKRSHGFLTSCPSNLGTGMRCGVHIMLPKLSNYMQILRGAAEKFQLQIRGTQGEHTAIEKAVFDLSNSKRLGITEKECCIRLYNGVREIIELEKNL